MPGRILVALMLSLLIPAAASAAPREASIGIYVVDITGLDEMASTFEIELDVVSSWIDPERATGERIEFREDAAWEFNAAGWTPEAFLTNAKAGFDVLRLHTTLYPDGRIVNRVRLKAVMRATLHFHDFPFDTQVLPLHVESYSQDATELALDLDDSFSGFDEDFQMPEWTVLGTYSRAGLSHRDQDGRDYSRIEFEIRIERRVGFYVWKIFVPLMVIVAISWVVFWMSGEGLGRRAGLSATGMLTVIAYQFIIAGSLPRIPYLTTLDRFALLALVFIAATMLQNLVTTSRELEHRARIDRACRILFPLGFVLGAALIFVPVLIT